MEVQLSLKNVARWLMAGIVWILIAAVVVGTLFFAYAKYIQKPVYQSSVMFFASTAEADSQRIEFLKEIAPQYIGILDVREFYEKVAEKLLQEHGEVFTSGEIKSMVSFSGTDGETSIFYVYVRAGDPEIAYQTAKAVADCAPEWITLYKSGDVLKVGSWPQESYQPVSPNVMRTTVLGILVGAVLAGVFIVAKEVLDNRVKSPEQIQEMYGLPVLGAVPDFAAIEKKGDK